MDRLALELMSLHRQAGAPSTRELGALAGLSHSTIANALNGRGIPRLANVLKIVEALDGDVKYFTSIFPEEPKVLGASQHDLLVEILAELRAIRTLLSRG